MLSLGSASVWNTPAVLNLYMGYRQTPDASQKRTVPSSCLQPQINRILLHRSQKRSNRYFHSCAELTLWAAGLSVEGLGPGSGLLLLATAAWREGKWKFNNNTNLMQSVQPEMKECVHTQHTAYHIWWAALEFEGILGKSYVQRYHYIVVGRTDTSDG